MRFRAIIVLGLFGLGKAYAGTIPTRDVLDQVGGAGALAWVRSQNVHTNDQLESDSRYKTFYDQVLAVEQSPERLALPVQKGGAVYNFWQSEDHRRGVWRRAGAAQFQSGHPDWLTILDVDRLAAKEHADWVFQGADCLEPRGERCLVALSKAGQDANTLREFDTGTRQFVAGGFVLPESKQAAVWVDHDSLLASRQWGSEAESLTNSGYPYIVKYLRRGMPLAQAKEIARGTRDDMAVHPLSLRDEKGNRILLIERMRDFFNAEYSRVDPETLALSKVDLPAKTGFLGFFSGQLIVRLDDDWVAEGETFARGSLVAIDLSNVGRKITKVFVPTDRESTGDIEIGAGGIIVVVYNNVQPHLSVFTLASQGWREKRIALPAQTSAQIVSASVDEAQAYVKVEGYILPPQLWSVDTKGGGTSVVYRTPDLFNADDLTTEQLWVRSTDGKSIPYFVVHAKNWRQEGRNPVLFTAYGGFDLSYLPTYYPDLGKTWFERGGVYVVGNIRGGGEFGPAWHEAGMKSGRQRAYDDFASIARDLVRRRITDQAHLAIRGRSNGGLLMGVEFTQHPELWKAVVIGVPLLDMLNYEHMAAGASWAAEYGRTAVPEERAFLAGISPLQNLKPNVNYPIPFIFTSTKDDRVGPVHARLFAARLESFGKPFFYYEDTEGGHSGTVNAREIAHERALEAVYLSRAVMDNR